MTPKQFESLPKYAQMEIEKLRQEIPSKDERVFFRCLEIVLQNCNGWSIDGKKIENAEGYINLARIFANHSVDVIRS